MEASVLIGVMSGYSFFFAFNITRGKTARASVDLLPGRRSDVAVRGHAVHDRSGFPLRTIAAVVVRPFFVGLEIRFVIRREALDLILREVDRKSSS